LVLFNLETIKSTNEMFKKFKEFDYNLNKLNTVTVIFI
jgi:hypothetical protein